MAMVFTTTPVAASKPRMVWFPRFATQIVPFTARGPGALAATREPTRTIPRLASRWTLVRFRCVVMSSSGALFGASGGRAQNEGVLHHSARR
jgi:hypothetical protein